jgi:hypothetical protein
MSNVFTYQVLKDTTDHAVIKLTGEFDGSGQEDNPNRISANSLYGALNANTTPGLLSQGGSPLPFYGLSIHRVWYDCVNPSNAFVDMYWNANPTITCLAMSGTYEYDGAGNFITIPNAAKGTTSCNGDIGIRTKGFGANTAYTIIVELRKDNAYYQRGQFNDPAAFNAPPYNIRP